MIPYFVVYKFLSPLLSGELPGTKQVVFGIGCIAVSLLFNTLLYNIGLTLSHKGAYHILENIRNYAKDKLLKMPMGDIEALGTGALRKLFTDDVETMEIPLAHAIPEGLANILVPVLIYIAMFVADAKLGFLSLASLPIGALFMFIMYRMGLSKMDPFYRAAKQMNSTILEYVGGMEVIKVFGRDKDSYKTYVKDIDNYKDYTLQWYKDTWVWMAAYSAVLPCVALLTLPVGSYMVYRGYSNLQDLVFALCMSFSVGAPLIRSMGFFSLFPQINYKIGQIEQLMHFEPLKYGNLEIGNDHSISFDHVCFSYEDKEVLHDVSLTIPQGTVTALVGESGSGKSTLAKLLVHFYDTEEGKITIGGTSVSEISLESLNDNISFVSQEQFLFNTSIYENICIGEVAIMKTKNVRKRLIIVLVVIILLFTVIPFILGVVIYNANFGGRIETAEALHYDISEFPGLERDQIDIRSDNDVKLGAWIYSNNSADKPKALIVTLHGMGIGGHNTEMNVIDHFVKNGYIVLAFDASGTDDSEGKAGGFPQEFSDAHHVLEYVRNTPELSEYPLLLWGRSMGAYSGSAL